MKRLSSMLKRESQVAGHRKRKRRPSNLAFKADHSASPAKSLLQSLLTLYGLVVLMLGVVIPISDALAKPVEHADYRQIFYIFMHGVGIGCIVYLNSLISCHQTSRKVSVATKSADANQDEELPSTQHSVCFQPAVVQLPDDPSTRDIVHWGGGGGGEVGEPDGEMATSQNESLLLPNNGGDNRYSSADPSSSATLCARSGGSRMTGDAVQIEIDLATSAVYEDAGPQRLELPQSALGRLPVHRRLISRMQRRLSRTSGSRVIVGESLKFPGTKITLSAVGVNLYLRLGAIVFGFGVMVHDGFKIADVLERPGSEVCVGPWFLPKHCIHLIFIMCQTYYVFKHHRVSINTQTSLVRFIFVHLIVTNLCIWVKTVIYEIKVGLTHASGAHDGGRHHHNTTQHHGGMLDNYTDYDNATSTPDGCQVKFIEEDSPSYKLGPYLYPCAVEYGLICAAICYKFFSRVGDTEVMPYGKKEHLPGPRSSTCHKSHKGLFLGLIIMICVLVPMISLIFLQKVDSSRYRDVYILSVILIECLVLFSTTAMAVIGTAKAIRFLRLFKVRGNEAFDVNLLFVGLAGIACYNLFVSISVGACLMDVSEGDHCKWGGQSQFYITKVNGLKSLLEVVQSVTQTLFIMQAIQRKVTMHLIDRMKKPGRGLTIALLIVNLAMWVASVFEAQRNIAENFLLNYFGDMPWKIIKFIFLPLIIFFRFHSTVCLSEIWIQSYKPPMIHHHAMP